LIKHSKFPKLKFKKSGVYFYSQSTHRIKIQNVKTVLIDNTLYLKTNEKVVIFSNVKDVKIFEEFLYFTGLGEVKILFDCEKIFRYFSIRINSKQFELETL
ncbi:MAG: hypothetical protein J6Q13_01055, partial [Clostridia bacterium]|nr:hypothetical protein [Clostridia bacterium]